jgi:hypothetical protein
MGLGETGDWQGAVNRIVGMINNKADVDPLEGGLPLGYGSGRLLEAFARELESEYQMELGMAFPVLLGAFSGATQGGFSVPMVRKVKPHPVYLPVPIVIQFLGLAEAGQQKSTLLGEVAPALKKALDREGADDRRALVNQWRAEEMKKAEQLGLKMDANLPDWEKVFAGGLAPSSYTSSGTPEGVRDWLVDNGGHRAILTAEPDIFREVSAYAGKGAVGSVENFVDGWDQEDKNKDRAGKKDLFIREPSLPCVLLMQPGPFRHHTAPRGGSDDYVDRGVFSRFLIWQTQADMVEPELPDLEDWDLPEDWDPGKAMGSVLGAMREKLEKRMGSVVARTNPYRVSKGVERAYQLARLTWDMPRPTPLCEHRILLGLEGAAGHRVTWRVQQMRSVLIAAVQVADKELPGTGAILEPFARRFTSHVMRLAAVLTLADDPGAVTVDTGHVEDVATRIMPWLWWGWWKVMRSRMEEAGQFEISEGLLRNTTWKDLTGQQQMLAVLAELDATNGPGALDGFTPTEIVKKVQGRMPIETRRSGSAWGQLRETLFTLAAEGLVTKVSDAKSVGGVASGRFRISELGRDKIKNNSK